MIVWVLIRIKSDIYKLPGAMSGCLLLLLLLLSHFIVANSVRPPRRQPTRLPGPWDSPGKNTGVGCHFLLHCMKVKSESEVAQSCLTPSDPMDCSLPGSSVHGIFQARVLEWGSSAFSGIYIEPYFNIIWWSSRANRIWFNLNQLYYKYASFLLYRRDTYQIND